MADIADSTRQTMLVFADDWGRHPSSSQHLIKQLLPRYPTIWVNTIGTRTPRLDWPTVERAAEKFRQWRPSAAAPVPLPRNLTVSNPRMWPWFSRAADRWFNKQLLIRHLLRPLHALPRAPVAITTLPIVAGLMGELPVERWVYYCVDDFAQWPRLDQRALALMEQKLVDRADRVVAASDELRDRLARRGRRAEVLTHGVDVEAWQSNEAHPRLAGFERPLVVFWGAIDRRLDVAMIGRLGAEMACGTIVLVGPLNSPAPELLSSPRVAQVPAIPFGELAAVAHAAAVLIMPYQDLPVTRAMQPLKLKEYMATGKPVVVTNLPAARAWDDCLDLSEGAGTFSAAVRRRLASGLPYEQRAARERLTNESWAGKAAQFERWIMETGHDELRDTGMTKPNASVHAGVAH